MFGYPNKRMALICHCRCVNDRVLHTAALATGGDLRATQELCGAGTRCGGCVEAVAAVVASVRTSAGVAVAVA
jgi:bacterioferritin-associated ferredoxin